MQIIWLLNSYGSFILNPTSGFQNYTISQISLYINITVTLTFTLLHNDYTSWVFHSTPGLNYIRPEDLLPHYSRMSSLHEAVPPVKLYTLLDECYQTATVLDITFKNCLDHLVSINYFPHSSSELNLSDFLLDREARYIVTQDLNIPNTHDYHFDLFYLDCKYSRIFYGTTYRQRHTEWFDTHTITNFYSNCLRWVLHAALPAAPTSTDSQEVRCTLDGHAPINVPLERLIVLTFKWQEIGHYSVHLENTNNLIWKVRNNLHFPFPEDLIANIRRNKNMLQKETQPHRSYRNGNNMVQVQASLLLLCTYSTRDYTMI